MNGRDVSQLAHEDAVAEFLRAAEPIIVEVKRRDCAALAATATPAIVACSGAGAAAAAAAPPSVASASSSAASTGSASSTAASSSASVGAPVAAAAPAAAVALETSWRGGGGDRTFVSTASQTDVDQQLQQQPPQVQLQQQYYKYMMAAARQQQLHQQQQQPMGGGAVESPAGSGDEDLHSQLFNDCLNPSIDIEVSYQLIKHTAQKRRTASVFLPSFWEPRFESRASGAMCVIAAQRALAPLSNIGDREHISTYRTTIIVPRGIWITTMAVMIQCQTSLLCSLEVL